MITRNYKRICIYLLLGSGLAYLALNMPVNESVIIQKTENNMPYQSHINIWPRKTQFPDSSVCLAVHSTVQYLHWIPLQADNWNGPISVSVYGAGSHWNWMQDYILYLRKCHKNVANQISFHVAYPSDDPPTTAYVPADIACDETKTSLEVLIEMGVVVEEKEILYPQNFARNLARDNCDTPFTLSIDIDMIPWMGMASSLDEFLSGVSCITCAYVIPIYEIEESGSDFPPRNKNALLSLINERKAQIYHIKVWKKNQQNSQLHTWEGSSPETEDGIAVLYDIEKFVETWEPISVLHKTAPRFDERFIGYGRTRSSHVYHLHYLGYTFHVLENAFLSHLGFQSRKKYSKQRKEELKKNNARFVEFQEELERAKAKS